MSAGKKRSSSSKSRRRRSTGQSGGARKSNKPEQQSQGGSSGGGGQSSASAGGPREPASTKPVFHKLHLWQFQALRDVLVVAAIVGIVWAGYALSPVTVPLLVALLLAYLFEPLIRWLCERPGYEITRVQAVTGLLIVVGGSVLIILAVTVPLVVGQAIGLVNDVTDGTMRTRVARLAEYVPEPVREDFWSAVEILPSGPDDETDNPQGAAEAPADETNAEAAPDDEEAPAEQEEPPDAPLTAEDVRRIAAEEFESRQQLPVPAETGGWLSFAGTGFTTIGRIIGSTFYVVLLIFLIPFYFFFFSVGYPKVLDFGRRLIPKNNEERVFELVGKMDVVVSGFVRGRIVISLIAGVLLAVGWFAMGVPYALILGVVVGVFFLVPYLAGIGIPLAAGLLFFDQFDDPTFGGFWWLWALLLPTLWFGVVQFIESYILTPKIAGKATNLDPVTIVVVVLAGASVLGVYGMLLAIPIAACGKIILTEVIAPQVDAWLRGEQPDPLPIKRGDE